MSQRTAELQEIKTQSYNDVRSLFQSLSDEALAAKTDNGWSVRELAGHITQSANGDIFVVKRLSDGTNAELPGPPSFIIDLMNWRVKRKFSNTSKADLLGELDKQHKVIIDYIGGLSEEQLGRSGRVLGMGTMTLYEYLKRSPEHAREHAGSIRRAIGSAPAASAP